jgi:hypothetical protein
VSDEGGEGEGGEGGGEPQITLIRRTLFEGAVHRAPGKARPK